MDRNARIAYHHEKGEWQFPGQQTFLREWRLYRGADLGRLTGPGPVNAAETTELTLTFTAGEAFPAGARLRLFTPGFNPYNFLTAKPFEGRATVRAVGPAGPLKPEVDDAFNRRSVYVTLPDGLPVGGQVTFVLGAGRTFEVSQVARPVPFYVEYVDRPEADPPVGKLIDFFEMIVRPLELASVRALVDPIVRPGEPTDLVLFAADRYDNRVDEAVRITFEPPEGVHAPRTVELLPGDGGVRRLRNAVTFDRPGVWRFAGQVETGPEVRVGPVRCADLDDEPMTLAFGDIHCHDYLSPGSVSPMEYYANARRLGLHFLALPFQTHGKNLDARRWAVATAVAESCYRPGEFVAIPAYEWQHYAFGHKNVYFQYADQPFLDPYDDQYDTVEKLYDAVASSDALVIPHHPGYGLDCHVPGTDWSVVDDRFEPVAEICSCHGISERPDSDRPLNKPGSGTWMQSAWSAGKHVGVIGGSDSHSGLPVNSPREPRPYPGGMACLYVPELTRRGVFDALAARRTYATTGARILLDVRLNGQRMGQIAPAAAKRELFVEAHGTDRIERLEVVRNNEPWQTVEPNAEDVQLQWTDEATGSDGEDFYYVRLRQADGEWAFSSPIWVAGD